MKRGTINHRLIYGTLALCVLAFSLGCAGQPAPPETINRGRGVCDVTGGLLADGFPVILVHGKPKREWHP